MDRYQSMLTFVRVVETGSFSAAARVLNVGQPAVSKAIAQLESRLKVRLLDRSTHGLRPTDAGHRFLARTRVAVDEADEADLAARDESNGLAGRLRVSAATRSLRFVDSRRASLASSVPSASRSIRYSRAPLKPSA